MSGRIDIKIVVAVRAHTRHQMSKATAGLICYGRFEVGHVLLKLTLPLWPGMFQEKGEASMLSCLAVIGRRIQKRKGLHVLGICLCIGRRHEGMTGMTDGDNSLDLQFTPDVLYVFDDAIKGAILCRNVRPITAGKSAMVDEYHPVATLQVL